VEYDLNGAEGAAQLGITRDQYLARRPQLTPFNELVMNCWHFAGGWDVSKLQAAAIFYEVDDLDLLLRLALVIRSAIDARQGSD
jgi:hypothetical protein